MPNTDTEFLITIESFNQGLSSLAHIDPKTFIGAQGQCGEMMGDILTNPSYLQQSPALVLLENGDQDGEVTELIRFILDKPTSTNETYAVGSTKLFKLTPNTVVDDGTPAFPQTITNMTEGESVIQLGDNLFIFYNKASGGDIATMDLATEVIDPDWGSTTDQALEKAPHPSAVKEDILIFGNGRYLGVCLNGDTLNVRKLDFGEGAEVVDVLFHNKVWYIAVNFGDGKGSRVLLYDPSAISYQYDDEVAIGNQKTGFLHSFNGVLYICYQDKTTGFFSIGWVDGRQLKPLKYFTGTLPNHRQKCLYFNTILFLAEQSILSCGAVVGDLPIQLSVFSYGGYENLGGIAAPFGIPMIASSDGEGNFMLATFGDELSLESYWISRIYDSTRGKSLGKATLVIVETKELVAGAKAILTLEGNQGKISSLPMIIEGEHKTRHIFATVGIEAAEDLRCVISYEEGSTTVQCPIRKIIITGNYVER